MMNYRNDIQILRGISVLYVVMFHLGFKALGSGFLGVDVFFVISGFLMAILYDKSDKRGFFKRRAERLLPAYYVVVVLTLLASFFICTQNEFDQVVSQSLWAGGFSSNIGFWTLNSYFSKQEFNPLLHLWSLGVEVQFYLIVPLLVYIFSFSRYLLPGIIFLSLVACLAMVSISPSTAFFMLPFRIWQFLIGFSVAVYFTNNGNVKLGRYSWLGFVGLLGVAFIPFFEIDGQTRSVFHGHPGLFALLTVLSTACVLVFGISEKLQGNILARALVLLGRYSYSIYLVHFPIVVLYLYTPFSGTRLDVHGYMDTLILVVFIGLASFLSYRYVEKVGKKVNTWYFSLAASALILLLVVSLVFVQSLLISDREEKIMNAMKDRTEYRCGKVRRFFNPYAVSCELTSLSSATGKAVLLVGNSHADSIKSAFSKVANDFGVRLFFIAKNNPLMSQELTAKDIVDEAVSRGVQKIILHYSSPAAASGRVVVSRETMKELVSLSSNEGIDVVWLEPVPVWPEHVPEAMYNILNNKAVEMSLNTKEYYDQNTKLFEMLVEFEKESNFERKSVVDHFCEKKCEYSSQNEIPYYFDSHHLTITGSNVLVPVYRDIVKSI